MSADLGDEKYKLFRVCDGSSKKAVYVVIPSHNLSEDNDILTKVPYGSIVKIFNVLVKYNEANDSYNLLVGKGTTIESQYVDENEAEDYNLSD
jgi:hypothetical protein